MEGQAQHQEHGNGCLNPEVENLLLGQLRRLFIVKLLEDGTHALGQLRAVACNAELLDQDGRQQADKQHGHGHRGHTDEELGEVPLHDVANQQVLRLAHDSADTAQGGAHGCMHHDVAQERTELLQICAVVLLHGSIVPHIVAFVVVLQTGRHLVVNAVETGGHGNDHRRHREGVQERRQQGCKHAEQQGDAELGAHADQNLGEGEQQHLFHEGDTRHHEDQQQDDREVGLGFMIDSLGRRHADDDSFEGQQATGLQRVALERHCQRENEFCDEGPASDKGVYKEEQEGV